jgi:hypothetical protein
MSSLNCDKVVSSVEFSFKVEFEGSVTDSEFLELFENRLMELLGTEPSYTGYEENKEIVVVQLTALSSLLALFPHKLLFPGKFTLTVLKKNPCQVCI